MLVIMTRALIVIDVQESFRQRPLWQAVSNPDIAGQVGRLVDARPGRAATWSSGCCTAEPGTGGVVRPGARARPADRTGSSRAAGEPLLTKTSHNAFTTTNLQQLLTERGIRELVVCGIRTEQCCETTARVASDLGYEVTFVTDATATYPIAHRDAPAGRTRRGAARRPAYAAGRGRSSSAPSTRWPAGSPRSPPWPS